MPLFHRKSNVCAEALTPGEGWEVRHRQHHKDAEGKELYIPERVRSELIAKAGGPLLALTALILTWILSVVFATRLAHIGWGGFKTFLMLQFFLWTIIRQGMAIVALLAFEIYYTTTSRDGRRNTLSLFALDAWMSLIITPINVFRGKFMHVLLILLPSLLSIFTAYATSGLLGRETAFELHETGTRQIKVNAAGGGSAHRYLMTGHEFLYNASQGCLATPNHRFVFVLEDNKVLIPSIPEVGTYASGSTVRAARINNIPSVVATVSARVESDRSVFPPSEDGITTVPSLGDISLKNTLIDRSSTTLHVELIMHSRGIHTQIYVDIHYKTAVSDLLFATFNNGTHINQVYGVRSVSETIPERLDGKQDLAMDSVLDNFIFSQNGEILLMVTSANDTPVQHLGLLLASTFGIRSGTKQNWLDGAGELEARVYEEREVIKIPRQYWAVAASTSGLLAIACILICIRRPTINGNLVQIVALLDPFIRHCSGACTPNWQKAYAQDKTFDERNMNQRVLLGYTANEMGEREIFTQAGVRGVEKKSYRLAFDAPERVTRDPLRTLYGFIAG